MATLRIKIDNDENKTGKLNPVKKFGVTAAEVTKRAALLEVGNNNRAALRTVKDGKDNLKDPKSQFNLRATKARVDTHWGKKATTAAGTKPTAVAATKKVLTRSNSVRSTTSSGSNGSVKSTGLLATESNAQDAAKIKTITVKAVNIENKISHVKIITKPKAEVKPERVPIRREDSNLTRRSLSKLKANLNKDKAPVVAQPDSGIIESGKHELKIVNVQSHSTKLLHYVENIDSDDTNNPILLSEYVNDIYNYLYHLEVEFAINENHLKDQKEVNPKMRSVLIDWINEVHYQFHLVPETFQMTVAIIDRYLQTVSNTTRSHLQLVGVTAIFIASKYEELYPPSIGDFVYITDDTYNKAQILAMEMKILKALDWNLARPLPIHFLRRYSKAAKAADHHHTMAKYFLELLSTEYVLAQKRPSEIAAASLLLSLRLFDEGKKADNTLWTRTLEYYSRSTTQNLRPLVKQIAQIARNAPTAKLKAVYQKYQSSKFDKISLKEHLYGKTIEAILNEEHA